MDRISLEARARELGWFRTRGTSSRPRLATFLVTVALLTVAMSGR